MANGGSIKYSIGFNVDKTGLNQLKSSLQEIKQMTANDIMRIGGHTDIQRANQELAELKSSIAAIDNALDQAFNSDLGTLNITKFNQQLQKLDLNKIYQGFSRAGAAGQAAFRNTTTQILTTNMQLKQTHKLIDTMATTMANTIKWGVASSVMNKFTGSVQQAYGYVKSLDGSLNDIRIVTEKSSDEMAKFAVEANKAAKALGKTTTDYTDAALIYYQQGLSEEEVKARAETTLKAANVTGQAGAEVSEQLTAVWNGYKVSAEEAELYVDKLAAVAATTAADLEELSTGMSKVASAASTMGVDVDQLNAQLATIVSVTRQAPESVGTALKTIYARMGDIEAGLDTETTLGNYTEIMAQMGFNVLDANGKLRDMGEVVEEIGGNWKNLSREQQVALSQTVAGTRQYNNLLALFDNWDMYADAMKTSQNAAGTLQKQQDIYMESTAAHLNQLKSATEDLYDSLLNPEGINPLIDGLTLVTDFTANFVDAIGGGGNALLGLGSIATQVFSKHLANGIATTIQNMKVAKENTAKLNAEMAILNQFKGVSLTDETTKELVHMKEQELALTRNLTNEERNLSNQYIQQRNELANQRDLLQQKLELAKKQYTEMTGEDVSSFNGMDAAQTQAMIQSFENDQKEFEALHNGYITIGKDLTTLDIATRTYHKAVKGLNQEQAKNTEAYTTYSKVVEKVNDSVQGQIDSANLLLTEGRLEEGLRNRLTEAIQNYDAAVSKNNTSSLENAQVNSAARTVFEAYKNAIDQTKHSLDNNIITLKQHKQQIENNTEAVKNLRSGFISFISGIQLRATIQDSIQLVSALGRVASAWNSLSRLPEIWNDDDLTQGEKMTQIISNLGMSLPMLVSGLSAMGKILKLNTVIQALDNALLSKKLALVNLEKLSATDSIKILMALNTLRQGNILTKEQEIAVNAILAKSEIAVGAGGKAAAIGMQAFKAAIPGVAQITLIIGAIIGLVAVFDAIHTSAKEAAESLQESVKSLQEAEDELKSLQQEFETTAERIEELKELASEGKLSFTEEEELSRLLAQNAALEAQIILEKQLLEEKRKQVVEDARVSVDKGNLNIKSSTFDTNADYTPVSIGGKIISEAEILGDTSEISIYDRASFDAWATQKRQEANKTYTNNPKILEYVEKAIQKQEERWQAQNKEATEDLKTQFKAATDAWQGGVQTSGDEQLIAEYKNFFKNYYEATNGLDSIVSSIFKDTFKNEKDFTRLGQAASLGDVNEDILTSIFGKDQANNLQTTADNLGLSLDDLIDHIFESGMEFSDFATQINKSETSLRNMIGTARESQDALNILSLGDESELEEEQITYLQSLEREYEKLGAIQDRTSHAYLEALREIKELQEEDDKRTAKQNVETNLENMESALENIQELRTKYYQAKDGSAERLAIQAELELELDNFNKAIEEIQNADYHLKLAIDADLATDVEDAFGIANELGQIQEMIGEDLTLTFEEAQNLIAAGYGDILQNAKETSEQTIDLDKAVVDSFIDGKQNEVNAARKTKIAELEGQKALLETQKEVLQKKAQALNTALTAQNKAEITAAMQDVNTQNKVYQANLTKLNDTLTKEKEAATISADINKELYNALGGMYQEYEADATELQADEIAARIANAEALYNAYASVGNAVRASMTGTVPAPFKSGDIVKAVYKKELNYDVQGLYEGPTTFEEMDLSSLFDGDKLTAEARAALEAVLQSTQQEIDLINDQIGSIDAGIAALKSVDPALDKWQSSLRTKSDLEEATKDLVDALEDELDIYHDINIELTKLETSLGKLEKQEEKLFGQDLVNNLNKQLDILDNQKDAYREKIALAQMEAAILRTSLSSQGVAFGADGTITNYNAMLQAKMDAVNALNEQYNQMSEDEQKAFKNTLEAAEKEYEKFKEDMERYEEVIHNEIPEMQEAIQEIIDREIEINIQKLNMEVELRLDLTEAQKDWDEFQRKVIDDLDDEDIYENAMADKDLYKTLLSNGVIGAGTDVINTTLDELAKMNAGEASDIYGDNKVAALENLEEQMTNLMDHLENLADLEEEIHQAYLDMVDKVGEAFDEQIEDFEYVNDLIDHNLKVVQLLKGDDAYADMALFYEQQAANNLDILRSQREAADYYKMMMETETDPEAIEKWTELWKDAVNGLNSAVEDAIENIIDKYTNTINTIFDELNDKLTNGLGLDYLTQAWELQNENADAYLDTVNSAFELQQLEAKYLQSIDESDSAKAQDQLNELMEDELKKLREKDKLTQYDIDRANAMYELKLKEIALEEAQQNKTQMRLRRDSSGNYSYQFVADADSIAEAQREVDEARNSLYNMDRDEYRENQEAILEIYTEYQEKMRDAANMSAEERALIEQEYNERINNLIAENGILRANLSQSAMMALADAEEAILMNEIIPQWDGGLQQMIDKIAGEGGLGLACEEAMNALDEATQNYNDDLAEIEETAGVSFDALADGQDTNIDLAETLAERQAENIELTIEEMDAVRGLVEAVEELRNAYDDVYASATQALSAAQELREAQYGSSVDSGGSSGSGSSSNGSGSGSSSSGGGSGSSGSGSGSGGGGSAAAAGSDMIKGLATAIWCHSNDGWGDSKSARTANLDQKIGAGTGSSVQALINKEGPSGGLYDYWVRVLNKDASRYFYSQFKTGGYTGAWGSEGKFAMLHEKELVLNQADTSNILTAVKTVRSIAPILEAIDSSISSRIAGIKPGLGGMIEASSSGINQNVQIEAHFPMATDRFEIEAAFNSLVNQATQHAFNTRR